MARNLFTRIPAWIRDAFNTQEPDLPNELGEGPRGVWPVVDVWQGGVPFLPSVYEPFTVTVGPAAGSIEPDLWLTSQADKGGYLLWSLRAVHAGGAAPASIGIKHVVPPVPSGYDITRLNIAVGEVLGMAQLIGETSPKWYPPGTNLRGVFPATGAGETLELSGVIQRLLFPGYRLIGG